MEIGTRDPDVGLLHVAIMTDIHNSSNYAGCIQDAISRGAERILVTGDITGSGYQSQYDKYYTALYDCATVYGIDVIESSGNHDVPLWGDNLADGNNRLKNIWAPRWRANMNTGLYFSQWVGNTHIVALGNDCYVKNDVWTLGAISADEVDWFENIVEEDHKNGVTTIVLCHWSFPGTFYGSNFWADTTVRDRIKNIVSSHDNVILFSGHTHIDFGSARSSVYQTPSGGIFAHAGRITESPPIYVMMDQIATCSNTRDYILTYVWPDRTDTVTFQHRVDESEDGHAWSDPTYTWSDNNRVCTAKRVCRNDGCQASESETVRIVALVRKANASSNNGYAEFYMTFKNPGFETQVKRVYLG